nr:MAG TPA: hypothetical protein [Caudoviricetes sp.]
MPLQISFYLHLIVYFYKILIYNYFRERIVDLFNS